MRHIQLGFAIPVEDRSGGSRPLPLHEIDQALELISGRFVSAWSFDHLQFGGTSMLEGFTALTWFSARHPRLHFGNAVLCQSYRNPAHLAKMAATLQNLSGGRFTLGLGAGWRREEYHAYGYDFPPAAVRVDQLQEAVQVIRALWMGGPATFHGEHYRVIEARCLPRPEPVPPLMIGAFKPGMLRLAVELADQWNVSGTSPAGRARRLAKNLAAQREQAFLYRHLATLRTDVPLNESAADLEWRGARPTLRQLCAELGVDDLPGRVSRWRPEP